MPEFPIYVIELDGDTWFCRNSIENNFPEGQYAYAKTPERALLLFRVFCDKTIIDQSVTKHHSNEGYQV